MRVDGDLAGGRVQNVIGKAGRGRRKEEGAK